jgi:hypothetical protein
LRKSGPKKEIPIADGMGWRRRSAAGGQPLTMRPHRTGNSQQFFCYWKLLPAIAVLLAEGWPRVHTSAFRTSIGPLFLANRETINNAHAVREIFCLHVHWAILPKSE